MIFFGQISKNLHYKMQKHGEVQPSLASPVPPSLDVFIGTYISQSLASKIVTTLLLIHFLLNLQSLHVKIIFLSGVWQQLFTIFCLQFYCQSSLSFCFSILEKIRFKSLRHSSILITSQELFSFLFWNGRDSVARYEKWLPDTENGRFYL